MIKKERFTVDNDGKYWDKINHKYVNLDYLFRLVDELDTKLENKEHIINEMAKTIRIYDDGYITLNKKYKEVVDENKQLKNQKEEEIKRLKIENEYLKCMFINRSIIPAKKYTGNPKDRYEYFEESDIVFDTTIQYGQYFKILDKREMVLLLNMYNSIIEENRLEE